MGLRKLQAQIDFSLPTKYFKKLTVKKLRKKQSHFANPLLMHEREFWFDIFLGTRDYSLKKLKLCTNCFCTRLESKYKFKI